MTPLCDESSRVKGGMIAAGGVITRRPTRRIHVVVMLLILCNDPVTGWIGSLRFDRGSSRSAVNSKRRELTVLASTRKKGSPDLEATPTAAASNVATDFTTQKLSYDLGLGKNKPKVPGGAAYSESVNTTSAAQNWLVPQGVVKPPVSQPPLATGRLAWSVATLKSANITGVTTRRMVARDDASRSLRGALWDETHFGTTHRQDAGSITDASSIGFGFAKAPPKPKAFYPDIDLSIPETVYSDDGSVDLVWDLLRWEAYQNQRTQHEPLLVSFLHSTILNHPTLESSLAFLLANRLQSPAMMISTQLQALIHEALQQSAEFRRCLRADMMAVRDRDPACHSLPDVFLYFKGFHALQSHRTASVLWNSGRHVLAQYLQSQVSQIFQIDIHPNATLGSGLMLDHGTGIVIGETAIVGHNCSILHHVTLGGSGKRGLVRHPRVGNSVLLGAGATVLGPVTIGQGSQVGAGTLVIADLPAHCVAVGVPARIIGSFIDVTEQPSIEMNQIMDFGSNSHIVTFESDGI